jgi:hypothetical protein
VYNYTGTGVYAYVLDVPMGATLTELGTRYAGCVTFTTEACTVPATDSHASHVAGMNFLRLSLTIVCLFVSLDFVLI